MQTLLQEFSEHENDIIKRSINFETFGGVLPTDIVTDLLAHAKEPASISELMLKFLPLASHYARPVISNFHVGAIAQGQSGALYLGANLEIAHENLGNSIHAEQSAINNALLHNEHAITRIAISDAPCGHCRQFLNEIKDASQIEIIVLGNEPTLLKHLLPESFGPIDLGNTRPLFKANEESKNLAMTTETEFELRNFQLSNSHSYAPHTNSPSAVFLKTAKNINVMGVYIENAAYNPSLSPFLSAIDQLKYLETDFSQITEIVLVEQEGAKISQRNHVEQLQKAIAPQASFTLVKQNHQHKNNTE